MKKLVILSSLFLAALTVSAQSVVSGTVVDKEGNPISNARVEVVGSTESCMTGLDGTFRMETPLGAKKVKVLYVGMLSEKQRVSPDMTVTLREETFWNRRSNKYLWLFSAQGAIPTTDFSKPAVGFMVGKVKKYGWYFKGVLRVPMRSTGYGNGGPEGMGYWYTGNVDYEYSSFTFGLMARLAPPIYLYAGTTTCDKIPCAEFSNNEYFANTDFDWTFDHHYLIDLGIMLRLGHFTLNAGTMYRRDNGCFVGNFGVGYCF